MHELRSALVTKEVVVQLVTIANRSPIVHRAATSAVGTYAAYVAHGVRHPALLVPSGTPSDAGLALPGDEIVGDPSWTTNFSIRIHARPEAVWPWIVQIGYGRAGWYTWYPLDNNGVASADVIVPELQRLAVGDNIADGPRAHEGYGVWRVRSLEPYRAMVLHSRRHPTTGRELGEDESPCIDCSWSFVLHPEEDATRLHVRVRAKWSSNGSPIAARFARWFFGLGDTVMENTMLAGIRDRVERPTKIEEAA
jgi:proline iminopeptidase